MTDELKPGRELDALVAERVMRWAPPRVSTKDVPPCPVKECDYCNPPEALENWRSDFHWRENNGTCWHEPLGFSTNITAAWQIVEQLTTTTKQWFRFEQHSTGCTATFEICGEGVSDIEVSAEAFTAPHAICLAALKTTGAR